jgi:hypothetical protein
VIARSCSIASLFFLENLPVSGKKQGWRNSWTAVIVLDAPGGKPGWKKRLDAIYLPGSAEAPVIEAERIEHGLKWSPVKAYAKTMPRGVGKSSNWRLFINYLTRAGEDMPENGVPFTAILTISDPEQRHPVFTDMRQSLNALGVRIEDIRTAARVVTRV